MLDYISDLMNDAQDVGWNPAKVSHAVLLCHMEEGKILWQEMAKIKRIRRTHTQRSSYNQSGPGLANKKAHKVHNKVILLQSAKLKTITQSLPTTHLPHLAENDTGNINHQHDTKMSNYIDIKWGVHTTRVKKPSSPKHTITHHFPW